MSKFLVSIILVIATIIIVIVFVLFPPSFLESTYSVSISTTEISKVDSAPIPSLVVHLKTPEPLKALYMTSCVASQESWRSNLKKLIDTTELNAVVIDIKDYTGIVSFPRPLALGRSDVRREKGCVVSDMKEYIHMLHEKNIYVIGRISVFQDPFYTSIFPEFAVKKISDGQVWKDFKGLSFIDVGAKPYWDYIVELSKEAYALGFDELNYDYVRYPSDGNIKDALYTWTPNQEQSSGTGQASTTQSSRLMTKAEVLESFFAYLHDSLKDTGVKTSVDLFGMTTTVENDMGIGQVLELSLPYFDYISPMVYPSHYPKTWNGFTNPAEYPYEVVKIAMTRGIEREREHNISIGNFSVDINGATSTPSSKFRPWLQDFNLGATYDVDKVRAQIQATYDVGLTSWMLWSAANKYTVSALLLE